MFVIWYYNLTLHEVGYIWIIINTPGNESGTSHGVPTPWNQHDIQRLTIKLSGSLFDVPLNNWHRPKWINVLESEILGYSLVPLISFVHVFVSKCIWIIDTRLKLKFDTGLPLLAAGNIGMVAIVKALLL